MPDFERTATLNAAPEDAYRYLADPSNLPRYIATMRVAQPEGAERLHVAADVQGRHEEGDARFHSDPEARRMEWSAPDRGGYSGSLQISASGGSSTVTIQLHVEHDHDRAEIDRVLDETVDNIRRLLA